RWFRCPPACARFPYTTLFRSHVRRVRGPGRARRLIVLLSMSSSERDTMSAEAGSDGADADVSPGRRHGALAPFAPVLTGLTALRSEEHTSELQSRENLVCRLL